MTSTCRNLLQNDVSSFFFRSQICRFDHPYNSQPAIIMDTRIRQSLAMWQYKSAQNKPSKHAGAFLVVCAATRNEHVSRTRETKKKPDLRDFELSGGLFASRVDYSALAYGRRPNPNYVRALP